MARLLAARDVLAAALLGSVAALGMSAPTMAAPEPGVHRFMDLAVSPDGKHVATVEGDASPSGGEPVIRSLIVRNIDGSGTQDVALPCGKVRECWPSSLAWSADGSKLAFALRKPGSHDRSIYTVSADGAGLSDLLDFNGTVGGLRYGPGGKLAMLAVAGATKEVGATQAGAAITGDLSGPTPEQRIGILDGGKLDWASPADMWVYQYDWRPDGVGFVGTAAHGDGDNNWWIAKLYGFDAKNGSAHLLYTPMDAKHQLADPVVARDGTIAFVSGIMSDFGSTGGDIFTLPASGGTATDITPKMHASARSLAWGCDGKLHAELLAGPETQLVSFADATKPATPDVLWHGEESMRGEDAGVAQVCPSGVSAAVHETFNNPPEIEAGSFGHWHDITHANAGLSMPLIARSVSWKSDGADVQGWLLLPNRAGKGKLPLIMVVHGGPAAAFVPRFSGPGLDKKLLQSGYALFMPNPRGSFGQGEAFTQGNVRDLGHGDLRDDLAGIDAVEHQAPIDDKRLGITGGSYGGFMTMWAVTQTNRFKAGVAAAGISDWLSYYGENGIDEWMIPYFGASVYDDPAVYAKSSPIDFIKNVKTPVFEYVGAKDIECPAPQTQEFWHALHDLGVPTSYAIYPGEGHGLRDPKHIADAQARTIAWFDKYLKPKS